jgi:hypothetical protein
VATAKQKRYAEIARGHGIKNPLIAIEEGEKVGIGPALAVAMLEQESGGKNVWGHDPTIFIGGFDRLHNKFWTTKPRWRGYVNEAGYREYKRQRGAGCNGKCQGVGPMQLTWWSTQDMADRNGGCWKPRANIKTGFQILAGLIREHGTFGGLRRYNGSGPRAIQYATSVLARRAKWRLRFGIRSS